MVWQKEQSNPIQSKTVWHSVLNEAEWMKTVFIFWIEHDEWYEGMTGRKKRDSKWNIHNLFSCAIEQASKYIEHFRSLVVFVLFFSLHAQLTSSHLAGVYLDCVSAVRGM